MIEFTARVLSTAPLTIDAPDWVRGEIHNLAERYDALAFKAAAPRRKRTTGERSQNHHLNGHVQTICMETGNDFDAVKQVVKLRAIAMGYPFTTFHGVTVPKSEADATTKECALLIDAVHQLAAEEGIALVEYEDSL